MKNNQFTAKRSIKRVLAFISVGIFAAILITLVSTPATARAFNPLDPFGFFDSGHKKIVKNITNNVTDSNNTNSNNTTTIVGTTQTNYPYNNTSPLGVSCYSTPTSGNIGQSVTWGASAYGGNGSYNYSWSGSEGLGGSGQSISKTYNNAGTKTASVTVSSGGQTVSQQCSNNVYIYDYNYNNNYNYNNYYDNYPPSYNYYPPTNYYNYNYYPLNVTCSANATYAQTGTYITWTANTNNNYNGYYNYSWNGTDGLYGSQQSASIYYTTPGIKTATVYVTGNGQQQSVQCSNSVNVSSQYTTYPYQQYPQYPQYQYPVDQSIQVACFPDATSVRIGTPVTWAVEATGPGGNFTYSWSGTDGLYGSGTSVPKIYTSSGVKSAIVTVTGANGQSVAKACGSSVTVKSAAVAAPVVKKPANPEPTPQPQVIYVPAPQQPQQTDNGLSAAALFSLQNVPWGWVAVLIILILFGTVIYLLFNRKNL